MGFARVSLGHGDREPADRAARRALDIRRRLAAGFPRRRQIRNDEVAAWLTWAELLIRVGRNEQAEDALTEASTLQDRADAELPGLHYNPEPLRIKRLQAESRLRGGRWLQADAAYREAMVLIEGWIKKGTCAGFTDLYNSYAWFLATCPDAGLRRPDVAVDLAAKGHEVQPAERRVLEHARCRRRPCRRLARGDRGP